MTTEAAEKPVERFHRLCERVVDRLPFGLDCLVAPTFLGFVALNSFTFAVDLVLLTVLHGGLRVPLAVAVTAAYACACTLSYFLNRILNFRSHGAVGQQFAVYVVVVVLNYLAFVLGVSSVLAALGVEYHVARVVAGTCASGLYVQRDAVGGVPAVTDLRAGRTRRRGPGRETR
jgi:putative flippase GtrA